MTRRRTLLTTGCLLTAVLYACSGADLTSPGAQGAQDAAPHPHVFLADAVALDALQTLGDPVLALSLASLDDAEGAAAIMGAVRTARGALASRDDPAARRHLTDVRHALDAYVKGGSGDVADIVHLDIAQLFLEDVENLIGPDDPGRGDG